MASLTRRSLVSAAPAALIATAAPALAVANPDAALLALREPYERTLAIMNAAGKPHTRAEEAHFAMRKTHPHLTGLERREASGLVTAERVWEAAVSANHQVILQIAEEPAHTIEGIVFKAKVSERESNYEPDLVDSIIADLVAIGGAHA